MYELNDFQIISISQASITITTTTTTTTTTSTAPPSGRKGGKSIQAGASRQTAGSSLSVVNVTGKLVVKTPNLDGLTQQTVRVLVDKVNGLDVGAVSSTQFSTADNNNQGIEF